MNDADIARLAVALAAALRLHKATDDSPEKAAPVDTAGTSPSQAPEPPAGEAVAVRFSFGKADVNLRLGVIYGTASTVRPDAEDDWITPEDLEETAVHFMERVNKAQGRATNTHATELAGSWVASWVDTEAGTWRVGLKPDDIEVAKAAARGDYVGFSLGGTAERVSEEPPPWQPSSSSTKGGRTDAPPDKVGH